MFEAIWRALVQALTVQGTDALWWQMGLRASVVFVTGIVIVRLSNRRFWGQATVFDMLLAVILGSVLSRAINGEAPLLATVAAALFLVALHWLLGLLAFHWHWLGRLVKGTVHDVVRDGQLQWQAMRRVHVTERDIREALRLRALTDDLDQVAVARVERSGEISIVRKPTQPQVVDVAVAEGVQTVRIELRS
ncbi:DUF421 domain-containing protein [Kallotenue papyrolyticum]|uniref:DUF421 domain-containing protein n=1 Tax=Kallotenue papyrolyticum TaxID=1325125 RepID=UPI00049249B8|nr:DUF421 domain-containing protein [Kallotenue papyrolyticum]